MVIEEYLNPEHSIPKEIAIMFALLGATTNAVCFISTSWASPDQHKDSNCVKQFGLWRICRYVDPAEGSRETCYYRLRHNAPLWFTAVQFLETVGFILQLASVVFILGSECIPRWRRNGFFTLVYMQTASGSMILLALGQILFYEKVGTFPISTRHGRRPPWSRRHNYQPDWAFYGMASGTASILLCLVLIMAELLARYRKQQMQPAVVDGTPKFTASYGAVEEQKVLVEEGTV